jgi:hypothetical protein
MACIEDPDVFRPAIARLTLESLNDQIFQTCVNSEKFIKNLAHQSLTSSVEILETIIL